MSLGPSEIIVVLLVALVVLGPDKLPAAARTLGKYISEFRKFSAALQAQVDEALKLPDFQEDEEKKQSSDGSPDSPNPPNPNVKGFELIEEPFPVDPDAPPAPSRIQPPPTQPPPSSPSRDGDGK